MWPLSMEWSLTLIVIFLGVAVVFAVVDLALLRLRDRWIADRVAAELWTRIEAAEQAEMVRQSDVRGILRERHENGPQLLVEAPETPAEGGEADHEDTTPLPVVHPRFGSPKVDIYHPANFDGPLRCSIEGGVCGGRELYDSEAFYEIPDPSESGSFVVVCVADVEHVERKLWEKDKEVNAGADA